MNVDVNDVWIKKTAHDFDWAFRESYSVKQPAEQPSFPSASPLPPPPSILSSFLLPRGVRAQSRQMQLETTGQLTKHALTLQAPRTRCKDDVT